MHRRAVIVIATLIATLAAVLGAAPAQATAFCEVLASPDGFVALRAAPDAQARVIARMHAGDEVRALDGNKPPWMEVYFWRGHDRLTHPERGYVAHGWVHSRYVGECG